MTKKIMLDTNIYDRVAEDTDVIRALESAQRSGQIQLIQTHVQKDEIDGVSEVIRKRKMRESVKAKEVATSKTVLGRSRLNRCRTGSGKSGGIAFGDIHKGNPKHSRDALIAETAAKEADVFVTEDKSLKRKVERIAKELEVWTYEQLREYLLRTDKTR